MTIHFPFQAPVYANEVKPVRLTCMTKVTQTPPDHEITPIEILSFSHPQKTQYVYNLRERRLLLYPGTVKGLYPSPPTGTPIG